MRAPASWSQRVLVLLTLVCWLLATAVLVGIVGSVAPSPSPTGWTDDHGSLVARLFGSSRTVLSRHLFLEADRYFHKGIGGRSKRAFDDALLIGWADQIAPTRHEEVSGRTLSEIMPWLQMAIGSDPQNFEAWAAAGYWLRKQGNMTAAVALMKDAQQKNPSDYRYFSALGQLYFFNRDYPHALVEFRRAQELWARYFRESEEDHLRGQGEVLTYLAGIHEMLGNNSDALEQYRELATLFPDRANLQARIAELAGDGPGEGDPRLLAPDHREMRQHILQFSSRPGEHIHHSSCTHD